MTIHLVYAKGIRTTAPQVITRELASRLSAYAPVEVHDLAECRVITPAEEGSDVLIGHPHSDPRTIFQTEFCAARVGEADRHVPLFTWANGNLCVDRRVGIGGGSFFGDYRQVLVRPNERKSVFALEI